MTLVGRIDSSQDILLFFIPGCWGKFLDHLVQLSALPADTVIMGSPQRLQKVIGRFYHESFGPTVTEYAVLLVLIVFGCFAVISLIGAFVASSTQSVAEALPTSSTP